MLQTERNFRNGLASFATMVMVALVVAFCAVIIAGYYVPAFTGVDENGYLCAARRVALTGNSIKHTVHPLEYVSENVVQTGDAVFYAKYPLGYPWLCALGYWIAGPTGTFLVNPILAIAAVLGMFLLARAMTNVFAGLLAAILLATNPWHLVFGISADSHSGATAFAVWGMYFLWRWGKSGGWVNAVAAGVLTAYAYMVRYSEALLILPILAIVVWRYFQERQSLTTTERICRLTRWRMEVALLGLAAIGTVAPLLAHHWIAFGGPFRTGYTLCGESTGFGWKWFTGNWWLMLTKLNTPGLWLIFPLGVAGLAYVAVHDYRRASLLGLWCGPTILLYTAYYWAPLWEGAAYLRFFVSVFPALIISALILLCEVVKPRPLWIVAVGVLVAITATFNLHSALTELGKESDRLRSMQTMCENVQRHTPAGAIIVASADALNTLEFIGDYELYSAETFDRNLLTWRTGTMTNSDPHPYQVRKAQDLDRALGRLNNGQLAALERSLLSSNMAAGRMVTVVISPAGLHNFRGRMGETFSYQRLTEWYQLDHGWKNDPRPALMALYRLQPRNKDAASASVEEQVDQQQFRINTMREEFDDQYPGARKKWSELTELERQLQALRDTAKQLQTRPRTN